MKSTEIRKRFLEFFAKRGHAIIPSASLVTSDEKGVTNPTLFNSAGMQPLIPYLLGKEHPLGNRLADVQKCLRTVDIDDIGDKTHATFFEMLGNWSLGDYFKREAINWSYEFLTSKEEGLGLDPTRLYVTVFEGDSNAPKDVEAAEIWKKIFTDHGVEGERIYYMGEECWWQAGENGPCGPDTEMYYDIANVFGGRGLTKDEYIRADGARDVVEVWNNVFMQYEKKDGKIIGTLPKPSVDTGAGLERLAMTMQGANNIYDTDLLAKAMGINSKVCKEEQGQRIVTDHLRASIFLIIDGVVPSNTGRGYILRRLLRRAFFHTENKKIGAEHVKSLVDEFASVYAGSYDRELASNSEVIVKTIVLESEKFSATLEEGLRRFAKLNPVDATISGEEAFDLFQSYGLPIEITSELAKKKGLTVDRKGYESALVKHQDLSRAGAEKKFKGGLADSNDPMVVRYHTATHLLHQALHDVLGPTVMQKGSNITSERLRFDFAHGAKMTDEDKKRVENIVNEKIAVQLPMNKVIMPIEEAKKTGALHFFGEKYGDEVSIYYTGDDLSTAYSKEFCGGPHVDNTKELSGPEGNWRFKIAKEEAVAQGIRRIKAVLQ